MEEVVLKYWFMKNEDVPYSRKYNLLEYFTDSYHLYHSSLEELLESGLMKKAEAERFIYNRERADIERDYERFCHSPFSFVTVEDQAFPEDLRNIYACPYGLFYNGRLPDFKKTVSIVGARTCSEYGKKMAFELGQALSENGYTVISGMARGIDTLAHKGCLEGKSPTVAVLGCGADVVYPYENRKLYEQIAENGAVISEFPMGSGPLRENFPQRNRIVSGLSKYVIVVEAALKSGSLITADFALEQGKDIYVVPGRVGDRLSEGCNKLITQGAGIILSTNQLLKDLSELNNETFVEVKANKEKVKLTKDQLLVYGCFDLYPKSLFEVEREVNMDYLKLVTVAYSLVRLGMLTEAFKNHFVICN